MLTNHSLVIGRVVGIHIKDEFITADGKVDIVKIRPLARMGYTDYTSVESVFPIKLSGKDHAARVRGLSGGDA